METLSTPVQKGNWRRPLPAQASLKQHRLASPSFSHLCSSLGSYLAPLDVGDRTEILVAAHKDKVDASNDQSSNKDH